MMGVCLAGAGCRRDMQDQPKVKPFRGSAFFTDGLGARQPIEGTIPRGESLDNLIAALDRREIATLGGLRVHPGPPWRLTREGPRRSA